MYWDSFGIIYLPETVVEMTAMRNIYIPHYSYTIPWRLIFQFSNWYLTQISLWSSKPTHCITHISRSRRISRKWYHGFPMPFLFCHLDSCNQNPEILLPLISPNAYTQSAGFLLKFDSSFISSFSGFFSYSTLDMLYLGNKGWLSYIYL